MALSRRIGGIETFNQFKKGKQGLTYKLYEKIINGDISNDDEAREVLYGVTYRGKKYNMLKERFKEKLYTNVLFVQPRKKNTRSYAQNAYYCHKHYVVAKLLIMIAARSTGRRIMKKVLQKAISFEVFEIAMLAALSLQRQTLLQGNQKIFFKYSNISDQLIETVRAENIAENRYNRLLLRFSTSYSAKPFLLKEIDETLDILKELVDKFNIYSIKYNYFLTKILKLELVNDYNLLLDTCIEFEEYLVSSKMYSGVRHANIIIMMLNAYLFLGNYEKGLELAANSEDLYESKEGNWMMLQEIKFLLALRGKQFQVAANTYKNIVKLINPKNTDKRQIEIWDIQSGHLWLALTANSNNDDTINAIFKNSKRFNLSKLMNETPIYSKDKEGVNLSLNILQFAILVQQKEFHKIIEIADRLKAYIYKYIDKKTGARDYAFLKMLLLLIKFDFNPKTVKEKASPLLIKLQSISIMDNAYSRTRIEIIPYEDLWTMLLAGLNFK